jgi:8-oxo-dGTP pyrophosphatase MutT (NUDIX family)
MSHINELIDYTVGVFVVYENKVLLRLHDKYNIWLSVGGHIELNEDPNQAAVREVKEEIGLDIALYDKLLPYEKIDEHHKELIPPFFMNIHSISEKHKHIILIYFAKSDSQEIIEGQGEKSSGWKWMTKKEIEEADNLDVPTRFYALRALEELG